MEKTQRVGSKGVVGNVDLWEAILLILEACGQCTEVHWLHVPSHIGIRGNGRADQLAHVGLRESPLLFGHIPIGLVGVVDQSEEDEEAERDRTSRCWTASLMH